MSDQFDLFDGVGAERPPPTPGNKILDIVRRAPAGVVPFPLYRRAGKVCDVAMKLGATKTGRHAEFYRAQVTHALGVHLQSKRVPIELHPVSTPVGFQARWAE